VLQLGETVDLEATYDKIWEARCRTNHLTAYQLLRRDLKCIIDCQVGHSFLLHCIEYTVRVLPGIDPGC
jgi:hypothetical protein